MARITLPQRSSYSPILSASPRSFPSYKKHAAGSQKVVNPRRVASASDNPAWSGRIHQRAGQRATKSSVHFIARGTASPTRRKFQQAVCKRSRAAERYRPQPERVEPRPQPGPDKPVKARHKPRRDRPARPNKQAPVQADKPRQATNKPRPAPARNKQAGNRRMGNTQGRNRQARSLVLSLRHPSPSHRHGSTHLHANHRPHPSLHGRQPLRATATGTSTRGPKCGSV